MSFQFSYLETPRLRLRLLTPEAMNYIFTELDSEDIMHVLGIATEEIVAKEREKFMGGLRTWQTSYCNAKLILKSDNRVIGGAGFHTWYLRHRRAEIGYAIYDDADKGHGYMKEALAALMPYGFDTLGLNRVEAMVATDNEPSLRLLRHFGFVQEGLLREHYDVGGMAQDSLVFSLLQKEFAL